MFANKDLEDNFTDFMKIIKFKHQKSNIIYAKKDTSNENEENTAKQQ